MKKKKNHLQTIKTWELVFFGRILSKTYNLIEPNEKQKKQIQPYNQIYKQTKKQPNRNKKKFAP